MHFVLMVDWIESERGWGMRPDGVSLHLDEEDKKIFINNYWERMPSDVPDEYSRPESGTVVAVNAQVFSRLKGVDTGLRLGEQEINKLIREGSIVRYDRRD